MRKIAVVAGLVCAWITGADVFASTVSVSPVRLQIVRTGGSVDLTLGNEGADATDYAVHAFRWRQSASGEIELEPTDDLIVYPQRLTLAPHQKRAIRIGYPGAIASGEGDYRIIATETASAGDTASTRPQLLVRSRLSIPLFVAPAVAKSGVAASDATVDAKALGFSLAATGTAHVVASSVRVRALDDAGRAVASADLPAWYLLPSEPRTYTYALAPGECTRVRTLVVDATFESGAPLHVVLDPKRAC